VWQNKSVAVVNDDYNNKYNSTGNTGKKYKNLKNGLLLRFS